MSVNATESLKIAGQGSHGAQKPHIPKLPVQSLVNLFEKKANPAPVLPPRRRLQARVLPRTESLVIHPLSKSDELHKKESLSDTDDSQSSDDDTKVFSACSSSRDQQPGLKLDLRSVKEGKRKVKFTTRRIKTARATQLRPKRLQLESSFTLTCLTPRTRSHYISSIMEEVPAANLDLFPTRTKDKSKFESSLRKFMRTGWENESFKRLNGLTIEKQVLMLCRKETDPYFHSEHNPLAQDIQLSQSPRAKELALVTQKSGLILLPVIERLNAHRSVALKYIDLIKEVTPNLKTMIGYLNRLISSENLSSDPKNCGLKKGKDLGRFLQIWSQFISEPSMKPFVKIIETAFGDRRSDRKEVLATLKKWNTSSFKTIEVLKANVEKMDKDNIAAMNIPFIQHEWEESPLSKNPIAEISPYEVVRCLHTGMGIPAKKIVINGKTVYEDKGGKAPTQEAFLHLVFSALYQEGLNKGKKNSEIQNEIRRLKKVLKLPVGDQIKLQKTKPIPALDVFRFCTNSAWGHGHLYIQHLYPELFGKNYWTKAAAESMEYHINVKGPDSFDVEMLRTYQVFHRLSPDSSAVDRKSPLARFLFHWKLKPGKKGVKGALRINQYKILDRGSDEKWKILYAVIKYHESDDSTTQLPGTPRMKSSPRFPSALTPLNNRACSSTSTAPLKVQNKTSSSSSTGSSMDFN